MAGRLSGPPDDLHARIVDAEPLFFALARPCWLTGLASPKAKLADLSLYLQVETTTPAQLIANLRQDPRVEAAYLAPEPAPPPFDIPPETPSFTTEQHYLGPGPTGFGFDIQERWLHADGAGIMVANVEYGFDPDHEMFNDLDVMELGHASGLYLAHGNGVMGMLAPLDDGYGVG